MLIGREGRQPEEGSFDLGPWRVDPGVNRIRHRGEGHEVHLEPKAMDLLVALAKRPGETVSKERLLEEVWHGAIVVESVVPKAVSALRQALGDSADHPEFILTVHRKGYRLMAAVLPVGSPEADLGAELISPGLDSAGPLPAHKGQVATQVRFGFLLALGCVLLSVILVGRMDRPNSSATEDPIVRLAVVPFTDESPGGGAEALTVALRAELLGELARCDLPAVFPIEPRPGDNDGGLAVAREIEADGLLEGDVRDLGDRIRIDLRLIETASGKQRWSTSIERSAEELWSFRHEVTSSLLDRLGANAHRGELVAELAADVRSSRAIPQDVYRLYLEARFLWTQRSNEGLERAVALLSEVTTQAPEFGEGFAWLALAETTRSIYLGGDTRADLAAAEVASERALDLAPDVPIVHIAAGQVAMNLRTNTQTAVARYQRAAQLAPNLAMAHQYLAEALSAAAEHSRAIDAIDTAVALDPISSLQHGIRGLVLHAAGRWEEAVEAFDRALVLDGHFWIFRWRAYAFIRLGKPERALAGFRRFAELAGEDPAALVRLDEAIEREGLAGYWAWLHGRYQFHQAEGRRTRPIELAEALAGSGQTEAAMEQLERAATIGQGEHFLQFRVSPAFDLVREDPRYVELYQAAGSSPAVEGG